MLCSSLIRWLSEDLLFRTHLYFHSFVPISPFGLDEGTDPEVYIEPLSLNFLDESHKIISSLEVVLSKWYNVHISHSFHH
jgi:hypothetical protein